MFGEAELSSVDVVDDLCPYRPLPVAGHDQRMRVANRVVFGLLASHAHRLLSGSTDVIRYRVVARGRRR